MKGEIEKEKMREEGRERELYIGERESKRNKY